MSITKEAIGRQMGIMVKLIGKQVRKAFWEANFDLTIEQFIVLNILNTNDNLTQQDLAVRLNKDKSGVLRHIDELEKKKLLVRMTDDDDRRKKILMLTKKGVEAIKQMLEIEAHTFGHYLKDVSEEELRVFSSVLKKIEDTIEK